MKQLALELVPRPQPSFENFVVGRNAELAALLVALARGVATERFVCLWGEAGSGRSHLLESVIRQAAGAGRAAAYIAAPAQAAALASVEEGEVLAVDDVHLLDGAGQRALFGAYNRIRAGTGALVVSANAVPSSLGVRPDLATRLAWGLVYEVHALNDAEKAAAMAAHAAALGFALPVSVQEYLLQHARRDLSSLLALVDQIDRQSREERRAITVPLVREMFRRASAQAEKP